MRRAEGRPSLSLSRLTPVLILSSPLSFVACPVFSLSLLIPILISSFFCLHLCLVGASAHSCLLVSHSFSLSSLLLYSSPITYLEPVCLVASCPCVSFCHLYLLCRSLILLCLSLFCALSLSSHVSCPYSWLTSPVCGLPRHSLVLNALLYCACGVRRLFCLIRDNITFTTAFMATTSLIVLVHC